MQNSSATFAGMVTVFCKKLGWSCLEVLLEQFQSRLSFGVCRELCNLVRIPLLNRFTARLFYQNGFQTVSSIANATEREITKLLRESTPFHSRKMTEGDEARVKAKAPQRMWLSGKEGLSEREASRLIIEEAQRILASDAQALGIPIDQLHVSKISKEFSPSNQRRKSVKSSGRKNSRKRVSAERITPWRKSKRPSPEQENTPREMMLAKLRSASRSRSKSISPLFREIQNVPTRKYFQGHNLSDSLFPDQPIDIIENATTGKQQRTLSQISLFVDEIPPNRISTLSQIKTTEITGRSEIQESWLNKDFSPPKGFACRGGDSFGSKDTQDSLMLHENVPTQIISFKEKPDVGLEEKRSEPGGSGFFESSDSLLFLSDTALEPAKDLAQKDCISSDPDISLRLSTTEENIELVPQILPPLKLQSHFNAALSGSATSPDIELFGDNMNEGNNSGDLFETTVDERPAMSRNLSSETVDDFLVIDVTASKSLFQTFIQEWKAKPSFAISFSCETFKQSSLRGHSIGPRIGRALRSTKVPKSSSSTTERLLYTHDDLYVTGLAVCWGKKDAYFIDLQEESSERQNSLDDTALPPDVSSDLPLKLRINGVRSALSEHSHSSVVGFNLKEQLKVIFELCDTLLPSSCLQDPKVSSCLKDPKVSYCFLLLSVIIIDYTSI